MDKQTLNQLRIDRSQPDKRGFPVGTVLLILLLLGLAAGAGWWFSRPKARSVRILTVRETVSGGTKTVLNASGYVIARRAATVSAKGTGKVIEVLVEEGLKVKAGQVLARLDDTNVKASLQLCEAQVAASKSSLEETRVRLDEAQRELQRVTRLAASQIASTADLDRATAEVKAQRARLDRQLTEVTVAERQVALVQQQMEDMVIRAPFTGIVVSKDAQPGEMVSPVSAGGGFTRTGICTLVDMDSQEIEVDVNESYINRVEPGQAVEATLDAYPDWKIQSRVIAIIPTADRQKATVKVRVGFDKLDPRILPQMGVKVAFHGTSETVAGQRTLLIPRNSVRRQDNRDVVWVVRNGRADCRAVTLGVARSEEVVVTAGLADGEQIVVSGPDNLAEGERLEALP
jgi:RND family efflux transporter MFP subunit